MSSDVKVKPMNLTGAKGLASSSASDGAQGAPTSTEIELAAAAAAPPAKTSVGMVAGVMRRFSTATTKMTGEGLTEYALFVDPQSLTKVPKAETNWERLKNCCCTMFGGYANNRLNHWKERIFPKLDGPVYVYDINSKQGDTFECVNDRDANGGGGVRRAVSIAGGLFQRNVLYKMLTKERALVPASDWAEEHERSEITEILALLQLVGAVAVNFDHHPGAHQMGAILDMPLDVGAGASPTQQWLSSVFSLLFKKGVQAASAVEERAAVAGVADAPSALSGRVLFRSNEKPPASLEDVLAGMGADFFHLREQPALLSMLKMHFGRGIQMATTFSFKHYASDTTWLDGMRQLQTRNCPPVNGVRMSTADVIDCGYRTGVPRKRYVTTFTVVFPDVKDGGNRYAAGPPAREAFVPGKWHPLCTIEKLDMPLLAVAAAAGAGGAAEGGRGGKAKKKKAAGEEEEDNEGGGAQ